MLNLRNGGLFATILSVLVYGIVFVFDESTGFNEWLHEGFLWVLCLVGSY